MKTTFSTIDDVLGELKRLLEPIQLGQQQKFKKNNYPLAFIIGNPRSGTTLFLQYLASLGCFSYPSNTLARFAYAPYLGAIIQQMLYNKNFDPLNELNLNDINITFQSALGKSNGAIAPNEFQHFFRNYINNYFPQYINKNEFDNINFESLLSGLASIEAVFNQPFVTKAMMIQYNLADFYQKIPNSIFFYIKRDPVFVMQSIYQAREKYFGDTTKWWSVKPKEYIQLKDLDVYHQIAGQVYYTDKSIEENLKKIPDKNKLIIQYEDFCLNPDLYTKLIETKYLEHHFKIELKSIITNKFNVSNSYFIKKSEIEQLKEAYNFFKNK